MTLIPEASMSAEQDTLFGGDDRIDGIIRRFHDIPGWPADPTKDRQLAADLIRAYPKLELSEQITLYAIYLRDLNSRKKVNHRARFANWCSIAARPRRGGSGEVNAAMKANALAVLERLQAGRQHDATPSETSLAIAAGREAALQTRLLTAGVPARYREAHWDNVRVPEAHEWKAGVLLEPNLRRGKGLLITGPVGTGKSSIAALVAREAATETKDRAPRTVRWEYFPSMLDELEDRKERRKVEARQTAPALLVWDDFLTETLAAWQPPLLDRIVELRYRARKSTIITTNIEPRIIAQDPALERIASRWQQSNKVLVVAGRDRRAGEQ